MRRRTTWDYAVALALFAGAVLYLSSLPRSLGETDESFFLFEAKRIRDGEVMYRDFFQFITPLSSYCMAALYWMFGTSMATARIGMAVVNAGTAVLLYAAARQLGVRRSLAAAMPLAQLGICNSIWLYASWHWFSTFLTALLFVVILPGSWAAQPRRAFLPGVVTGLLLGTQQQKGVLMAAGIGLLFVLDHLVDRRYPNPAPWRPLGMRLVYFAAGVAAVMVPLLAVFAWLAGLEPLFNAFVLFPLVNYRKAFSASWGSLPAAGLGLRAQTLPTVLTWSPVALVLPLLEAAAHTVRRVDRERVRALLALIVLCIFATLGIWYLPGLVHIAFIAGGFWVCAAVGVEWLLSFVRPARVSRLAGAAVAAAAGIGLVIHLAGLARLLKGHYAISHQTAFGRIDFSAPWEPAFIEKVDRLLAATPSRTLFAYPARSAPYLVMNAHNPTRYQYFDSVVSPAEQTAEVMSLLERGDVPYVILYWFFARPRDRVVRFIQEHYEPVPLPDLGAQIVPVALFRRMNWDDRNEVPPP